MLRVFCIFLSVLNFVFAIDEIKSIQDLSKYAPKNENRLNAKKVIPMTMSEDEVLNKKNITMDDLKMIAPTDEPDINIPDDNVYQSIRVTDLILRTANAPKFVYINQIFKMDLKADIQQNIGVDINTTIDKTSDLKWLNQENLTWIKDGKGLFETTLWFEANSTKAALKNITVTLNRNGEFFQKASIKPKLPVINTIENKNNYSHIAADDLKIKNYKTSRFDDTSNIMTVNLNVINGNLSSFYLDDNITKQGVDSIRGDFSNQSGYYFAVFDKNIKKLDFNYFNLKSKKFENFSLDVRVEAEDLSTQIGLNPKESKFKLYKDIVVYALAALFLVMFIISKNTTPLIFAILTISLNFFITKPYAKGSIKENTVVKILPIPNSTIFHVASKKENVEIFDKNGKYYKILLADGKIGWVFEDDIEKN